MGAKREIYQLMNELAERGVPIIMISSDLPRNSWCCRPNCSDA